jgi:hypothetical protein
VFVREDAADTDEDEKGEHHEIDEDAVRLFLDVFRQNDSGEEKGGGYQHDVARREGRFAGAVGAGVPDEYFVKNYVGDTHDYDWHGSPS